MTCRTFGRERPNAERGNNVKDQVVIVTGGSNGMGKAMAERFAKDGAKVVITGRNLEKLEAAKADIETYDGQVLCVQMDVRDPELVQSMVEQTKAKFGRIDALVN